MADDTKIPELPPPPSAPMLQMDGIRVATLAVLAIDTLIVVLLSVFLVNNVQSQRQVNECYQVQNDLLVDWAIAAVQAGRSDRQAQRELLLAQESGIDRETAIKRYLAQLDTADQTRSTAPVPARRCTRP